MAPKEWHDINDAGFWHRPKPAEADATRTVYVPLPEPVKGPLVKLSQGRFLPAPEGVDFNKKCKVKVKVDFLSDEAKPMKKVTFDLHSTYNTPEKSLSHQVDGYEKDGWAEAELTMYYPPDHKGDDSAEYYFMVRHIKSDDYTCEDRIILPMTRDELADASIFYLPGTDEYLIIDEKDSEDFIEEVKFTQAFADKVANVQSSLAQEKDQAKVLEQTKQLEREAKEKFEGLDKDPGEAIEELIAVKKNKRMGEVSGMVYIRKHQRTNGGKVRGHLRAGADATIKKKLKELLEAGPEKPGIDKRLTASLMKTDTFEADWPHIWYCNGKHTADKPLHEKKYFNASAEAQWLRFIACGAVDSSFSINERTLQLGVNGSVEYLLGKGTVKGTLSLPDINGVDVFGLLGLNGKGKDAIVKNGRECRFRLQLVLEGYTFAQASASLVLALPNIDFSKMKKNRKTGKSTMPTASVGAIAGASAIASIGADFAPSLEWSTQKTDFKTLAEIEAAADASAGAAAEASAVLEYKEGKLHIELSARAVAGIGGAMKIECSLGIDEGFALMAHIFNSVDYHRVVTISDSAFKAFQDFAFAQFVNTEKIAGVLADKAMLEVGDFGGWLSNKADILGSQLTEVKGIIRKNINDAQKLLSSPPETLGGQVLKTIMSSVEEDDFEAIIQVLQSAKSDHELKWILRNVPGRKLTEKSGEAEKGEALLEGLKTILIYGGWNEKKNAAEPFPKGRIAFLQKVLEIVCRSPNNIKHPYHI
jgi:transcription initiation factor IIF auxiliary subunit